MRQIRWDVQEVQPAVPVFRVVIERRQKSSDLLSMFQIPASKSDKFLFSVTCE